MKNTFLLVLITSISFFSCKTDIKKDKIEELGNRYSELNHFSGTILVLKKDSIIFNSNYGFADYENSKPFTDKTAFKIGSASELITKNIVETLINEGKINPNDSISKHIPKLNIKFTINDLLNHNTNFPSIKAIAAEKNPLSTYNTLSYANYLAGRTTPKTKKSDLNYNILGLLIETITNKSFQKNIEDYSKTLGLENTFYKQPNAEIAFGYQYLNYRNKGLEFLKTEAYDLDVAFSSNGIKTSAKDLAKIIKFNSKDSINIHGYTENDGFSYSIKNEKTNNISILVISNLRQPVAVEISNSITAILNDKPYKLPLARQPFDIDKKLLADYTGHYNLNDYMKFEVITRNDSLFTILGPNEVHIIPQSKNQFYMRDNDASMRFLRDSFNTVNRVELLNGFLYGQIAKRVNE